MNSVMLGTGRSFEILGMVALQTLHEGRRHLTSQEMIFSPGLLPAPPARVAKNIHIRRPEVESLILIGIAVTTQGGMILRTSFIADRRCHAMDQFLVPGRGHADCLRENRGTSIAANTMQGLTPIVVGRNVQARH